jgi:hypothetical protein
VHHSQLIAGGITEDGTAAKLLSREVIATGRKLTAKEGRLILIREDEFPGIELV